MIVQLGYERPLNLKKNPEINKKIKKCVILALLCLPVMDKVPLAHGGP